MKRKDEDFFVLYPKQWILMHRCIEGGQDIIGEFHSVHQTHDEAIAASYSDDVEGIIAIVNSLIEEEEYSGFIFMLTI